MHDAALALGKLTRDKTGGQPTPRKSLCLVFVFSAFVLVVNLLVDIVYGMLDPRIRYA